MKRIGLFVLLLAVSGIAVADVVVLKDGRQLQAQGFWIEDDQVKWVTYGKINSVPLDQMAVLERQPDSSAKASEDGQAGPPAKSSGKSALPSNALDKLSLPDAAGASAAAPSKAPETGAAELNQQAKLLIKDGRYTDTDKASSLLEKAMALDPGYSETYHNLGQVYLESEDYENAVENLRKGIALDTKKLGPDHSMLAPSYYNLGQALYKLDDYDGAVENYQRALAIRQAHPEASFPAIQTLHNRLGLAYSSLDDFDRSIDHYLKALEIVRNTLGPDHLETAVICNNLGAAYFKKKDYNGATRYFQQALDIRRTRLGGDHPSVEQAQEYLNMATEQQQSSGNIPAERR